MSTGDVKDFFTHILQRGKDAFQNAASKIHINGENVSNGDYALVVSQTGQSRHMTYEDFKLFLSDPIVKQVISGFVGLGLSAVLVYLVHRWIDPTSKDKTDAKTKAKELLKRIGVHHVTLTEYEYVIACDLISPLDINMSWQSIGGLHDVINEIKETVILPFSRKDLFNDSSLLCAPKGVLLYGPPGCGKTMVAKATAKASGVRFINLQVSSLLDKWYGEPQKRVAAIYSLAIKLQPVIIFIDEIDSLFRSRSGQDHEATGMIKTQFMIFWDGLITDGNSQILIMGATNRPDDVDQAILRRMPCKFHIGLPDEYQRVDILRVILENEPVSNDVDFTSVARMTEGLSGSDLKELCRLAAMLRVREYVQRHDVDNLSSSDAAAVKLRPIGFDDFRSALTKMQRSGSVTSSGVMPASVTSATHRTPQQQIQDFMNTMTAFNQPTIRQQHRMTSPSATTTPPELCRTAWRRRHSAASGADVTLPARPHSLRHVLGQLWCCHDDGVTALVPSNSARSATSGADRKLESFPVALDLGSGVRCSVMYDVAECGSASAGSDVTSVALATDAGLHVLQQTGAGAWCVQTSLCTATSITSVVARHGQLYAACCDTNELFVYHRNPSTNQRQDDAVTWRKAHACLLPFKQTGSRITLAVHGDSVFCCSNTESVVYVMSVDGNIQQTYNCHQQCEGASRSSASSVLKAPYICSSLAVNTSSAPGGGGGGGGAHLLLADEASDALLVLSEHNAGNAGEMQPLLLQLPVSRPLAAAVVGERLYVVTSSDRGVYEYVAAVQQQLLRDYTVD